MDLSPSLVDSEEGSGAVADGACTLLGNAVEAWSNCVPKGFTLPEDLLDELLSDVVGYFAASGSDTPETDCMFAELFVPGGGDGKQPLFQKMLKARGGVVHFLYFWRAFGQAARVLAELRALTRRNDPGERLAEELETLRDALLRTLETQDQPSDCDPSLAFAELAEAVEIAAGMSSAPGFWREVEQALRKPKRTRRAGRFTADELAALLLSWVRDAAAWQAEEPAVEVAAKDSPLPVLVHIYHVGDGEKVRKWDWRLAGRYSPFKIGGPFHAGVEVNGLEWSFGTPLSGSVPGVACNEPRKHAVHTYRQTFQLRPTELSVEEVAELLSGMVEEYLGDDCHLPSRSSVLFADDFARRLGVGRLPGWVHRQARMGALVDGAMSRMGCSGSVLECPSDPSFAKLGQDAPEARHAQVIGQRRPSLLEDAEYARKLQEEESQCAGASGGGQQRQRPRTGSGKQLGGSGAGQGLSQEEVRNRQIEAAERRQASMPGVSQEKARAIKERQQKDELLGKLSEHYSRKKLELPMGLNAASAAQLRKHWETVRSGDASAAVLGN